MKRICASFLVALSAPVLLFVVARAADPRRVLQLPTSKNLTLPVPGYIARSNGFPATIAVSPDNHYAALLNQGYGTQETAGHQSIAILDLSNNQLHDFPDERLGNNARQSYFIGLAFSSDGKHLYASMGSVTDPTGEKPTSTGNGIAVYKFTDGRVTPERFIKIPPQKLAEGKEVAYGLRKTPAGTAIPYPAGFAVLPSAKGDRLLIANNLSDNVVLLDVTSGEILQSFDLSRSHHVPAAYPYTVIANKAGTKAWCSLWNSSDIAELNLETGKIARSITVLPSWGLPTDPGAPALHPTATLLNQKEDTLYVTLSNLDGVVAIDVPQGKFFEYYDTQLHSKDLRPTTVGTVPQALALSPDGKRLYAATAALNAVSVLDLSLQEQDRESLLRRSQFRPPDVVVTPRGFIPTEWYPSAIAIVGNDLLIASAKGEGSGPNNMKATVQIGPYHREQPYIATLMGGSVARISLIDIEKNLAAYTRQVEEDNLLHADPGKIEFAGGTNRIRHVIYILKENRTYDQIFGDLPVGDGDPSLTMYGADITPNQHKLALQFGVLDNFYDSGEVSGDGHLWSTAATTSDYNEKTWPIAYRGKERTYDFGGAVADDLALEKGIPDVDDPGTGFLWDSLSRQVVSYRIYGEFVEAVWCKEEKAESPMQGTPSAASAVCPNTAVMKGAPLPSNLGNPRGGPSPWPWPVPLFKEVRPEKAALRGHYDPNFPDFNTDYPDQLRADEFLSEFDEFVKARATPGSTTPASTMKDLPQFTLLYLPDDHTGGTRPAKPTPQASVADNDLAVGRVVEAVSHSPYWDDTAIFVVEDDAQNGADHVDAHRSTALVISKYSPRTEKTFVDHHFYTTVSMIHTMESLLGLQPMNLFDAHAPLMAPLFNGPGTQPPYTAEAKNLQSGLIYQVNEKRAAGAKESLKMDFSRPDAADTQKLNAILWRNAKGDLPIPIARPSPSQPSN